MSEQAKAMFRGYTAMLGLQGSDLSDEEANEVADALASYEDAKARQELFSEIFGALK